MLLGAAPGVGKTYAMLAEGRRLAADGVDVVVAFAETHRREAIEASVLDFERIPPKRVSYRGTSFEEMDADAVIARRPEVALVDELAHANVHGGRRLKRWQDVEDLLDAGIDVITNVNIQHLSSLNETVETLTGVAERETVPDAVIAAAERVELIDVDPGVLRSRLASSDVLAPGLAHVALSGYTPPRTLPPSATWRSDGWRTMVCSTRPGDPRRAATGRLPRAAGAWSPRSPETPRVSTSCAALPRSRRRRARS